MNSGVTNEDQVAQQIADQLLHKTDKQPGAILLKGGWGVGKTHFWKEHIKPKLGEQKCVYVSLFGLQSVEQLKNRLVTDALTGNLVDSSAMAEINRKAVGLARSVKSGAAKLIAGYTKKKFDIDIEPWFEVVNIKLDPILMFPKNLVVCLDDLERCSMPLKTLLSTVLELTEEYGARMLVIGNEEEILKDSEQANDYKKQKEKVIWFDLLWATSPEIVFDHFLKASAEVASHERIRPFKHNILSAFTSSGHKNLRTLQKIIRSIELVTVGNDPSIADSHIRLLTALTILNVDANLSGDPWPYRPDSYTKATLNKDEANLAHANNEAVAFRNVFFEDQYSQVFSNAIYQFVRTGVFDRMLFLEEIESKKAKLDPGQRLLAELNESTWYFLPETEIKKKIEQVETFIKSGKGAKFSAVLKLYSTLHLMSIHVKQSPPDVLADLGRRAKESASIGDQLDFDDFWMRNESEKNLLEPIINQFKEDTKALATDAVKDAVVAGLTPGAKIDISSSEIKRNPFLVQVLADLTIWDQVDAIASSQGEKHFRYYQYAGRCIQESSLSDIEKKTRIDELKARLAKLVAAGDASMQTRLSRLSDNLGVRE